MPWRLASSVSASLSKPSVSAPPVSLSPVRLITSEQVAVANTSHGLPSADRRLLARPDRPLEQFHVPLVGPHERVEHRPDDRYRADDSIEAHVQTHPGERPPRDARAPRLRDDVAAESEPGEVAGDRDDRENRIEPESDVGPRDPDEVVEEGRGATGADESRGRVGRLCTPGRLSCRHGGANGAGRYNPTGDGHGREPPPTLLSPVLERGGMASHDASGHYIDGEWTDGEGEATFESENPATGESLGTFRRGTPDDVARAVDAADRAFEEWRERSYVDRAEVLWDVYHELRDRTDELGKIVTRECGKEISEGRADVVEAAHMVEWAAGNARHPHGDVVPSEIASKDAYMRRKPRGVTGCITPWNFPVAIPFWQMAVALVEGNTVVWKPAEQTPWCGQIVGEMMADAGVPDGVFNLVQGFGDAGAAIVDSPDVDTVLFTGSAEVGSEIASQVGGEPGKRVACEMGGKNGIVITAEADLDIAVHAAVMSSFKTTGQRCVSSERLIVHTDVYDEFKQRFVDLAEDVTVGDPLSESTFMGPVVDESQVEKFHRYNDLARREGVSVLVDRAELDDEEVPAGHEDGHWVGPFVYEADAETDLRCTHEEVFGPHVALLEYSGDVAHATHIHNDTDYGLAGAIISENYREINHYRDHAEVGLAYANLPCIGAEVQLPFGGVKKSGNGYPSAREVIEAVTDRTAWTVNNSTEIEMAQGLSAEIRTGE